MAGSFGVARLVIREPFPNKESELELSLIVPLL
jgi:hypothetical protein